MTKYDSQLHLIKFNHHNRFTAFFPGPPGWAGARRELLDLMVQGKINRGKHIDHPAGCHSIRTNQCPPLPSSPYFFTGRMPFLPPNQQRQSTEGKFKLNKNDQVNMQKVLLRNYQPKLNSW